MRNLKVGFRLTISFAIIIALFLATAVICSLGIYDVNRQLDSFYSSSYQVRAAARDLETDVIAMVMNVLRMSATGDPAVIASAEAEVKEIIPRLADYLTVIENSYVDSKDDVETIRQLLAELKIHRDHAIEMAKGFEDPTDVSAYMEANNLVYIRKIQAQIKSIIENTNAAGEQMVTSARSTQSRTLTLTIVLASLSLLITILVYWLMNRTISDPLNRITKTLDHIADTGDLTLDQEQAAMLENEGQYQDEIGKTVNAINGVMRHILLTSTTLKKEASMDLTSEITLLSDRDILGTSLKELQDNLNLMIHEIQVSTSQVSASSSQIADSAQTLALGVTEQSSAIEELSSSVLEISKRTENNALIANKAKELGLGINKDADRGMEQMSKMIESVDEINNANIAINRITEMIEDIAFQTNILALNAAIEAARAGEHGKGFAVIVGAVRDLSKKSAEAAATINQLVATSMEKSNVGATVSRKTAEAIGRIVSGIQQNVELVTQISETSNEQNAAISQISLGVSRVSEVVHKNSIAAEQSAAASEEMSRQAMQLQDFMSGFKLKKD